MTQRSPSETAQILASGLLSFPVTHFTDELEFDGERYRAHLRRLSQYDVAGLFAAGGTGEFFSLSPDEVDAVVRAAVDEVGDGMPLIAPAGVNTAQAIGHVRAAEAAGADGVLLFPQYLTDAPQSGTAEHIIAVCKQTGLGVIVYGRGTGALSPDTLARVADACPNLIGYKDGLGDLEQMVRIREKLQERLIYIGGLPTAELFAQPYLGLGVTTYSSAAFNFVPELAVSFYRAIRSGDVETSRRMLRDFYIPLTKIRDRSPGYAVSMIKEGLNVTGFHGGRVRPPLVDLAPEDSATLSALIRGNSVSA